MRENFHSMHVLHHLKRKIYFHLKNISRTFKKCKLDLLINQLISRNFFHVQLVQQLVRKWKVNPIHLKNNSWLITSKYFTHCRNPSMEITKFLAQISWIIEITKELIWRIFFVRVSIQFQHSVNMAQCAQCGKMKNLLSLKRISSNQLFSNFFSKTAAFTKFLPKLRESKFP